MFGTAAQEAENVRLLYPDSDVIQLGGAVRGLDV